MFKSIWLRHSISDVIYVKQGEKCLDLQSDVGKPQKRETSLYLSKFKIYDLFVNNFGSKLSKFWSKNRFSEEIYHENTKRGAKMLTKFLFSW